MVGRNYVHALRFSKRMSQSRLADLAGLTSSTISRLERHDMDVGLEAKARILVALGIPMKSYRQVFPNMPYQPNEPDMPTGEEVKAAAAKRRTYRNQQDRNRRQRERLWLEQDLIRRRKAAE